MKHVIIGTVVILSVAVISLAAVVIALILHDHLKEAINLATNGGAGIGAIILSLLVLVVISGNDRKS